MAKPTLVACLRAVARVRVFAGLPHRYPFFVASTTYPSRPTRTPPTKWAKRAGVLAFMLPAITALGMVGQAVVRSGDRANVFTEAQRQLSAANTKLPFPARLPSVAPAGSQLIRVILDEPDEKRGPSIYALDLTYTIAGGQPDAGDFVRLWQTNDVYLKKRLADPTLYQGDPRTVNGARWFRRDGQNEDRGKGVSYSRRFDDGVTVVVSGPNETLVSSTISSLVKQP